MGKIWLIPFAFLLIFASPFMLWNAASQSRESDFRSAKEVNINSNEDGYILIEGEAIALEDPINCPLGKYNQGCLYVYEKTEQYKREKNEVCTSSKPQGEILKTLESKCDESGSCTPCYLLEEFSWDTIDTKTNSVSFKIGDYEINSIDKANKLGFSNGEKKEESTVQNNSYDDDVDDIVENYIGEQEYTGDEYYDFYETGEEKETENIISTIAQYNEGDIRHDYKFLPASSELVVVGESSRGEIYKGDSEFVVSALSYGETLNTLSDQDSSATTSLRILSFFSITLGFVILFGTLASIPMLLIKVIPLIGKQLNNLANTLITFIGFIFGAILWVIMFIIISVLKSAILMILILAGLGAIAMKIYLDSKDIKEE